MNVQLKKFQLNNRTIGFHLQTQNLERVYTGQQRVPWNYTTEEVSFDWSNHTILSTESKVLRISLYTIVNCSIHLNACTIDF